MEVGRWVCANWACLARAVNRDMREEKREEALLPSDCGRHPPLTLDFHWGDTSGH